MPSLTDTSGSTTAACCGEPDAPALRLPRLALKFHVRDDRSCARARPGFACFQLHLASRLLSSRPAGGGAAKLYSLKAFVKLYSLHAGLLPKSGVKPWSLISAVAARFFDQRVYHLNRVQNAAFGATSAGHGGQSLP